MGSACVCKQHRLQRRGGSATVAAFLIAWLLLAALDASHNASASPVQSQERRYAPDANAPLILYMRGDIWTWSSGKLQQRTAWGYNKAPVLAPNGNQIAYKSTASIAVDAIKRLGGIGGGDLPGNIWLLDVATNDAIRVADQPAGASMMSPNTPDKYVVRSDPSWSPDGSALAWTELLENAKDKPEGTLQLVVYNLKNKTTKVIVPTLPPQYGVPAALTVLWGDAGIAVRSTAAATDAKGFATGEDSILVYDPDGNLLSTVKIGLLSEFSWIKDRNKDYIAVLTNGPTDNPGDPEWVLVEPQTGRITGMQGGPELYSPLVPGGVSLVPTIGGASPEWQIASPGKPMAQLGNVDDVYVFSAVLAISPDGRQVAYVKQGAAFIYNGGQVTKVAAADVSALAWGPLAWRVRHGN